MLVRAVVGIATAVSIAGISSGVRAQAAPEPAAETYPRFAPALFGGAAVPLGQAAPDVSMSDALGVPLVVGGDLGVRFTSRLELSLELLGLVRSAKPDACPETMTECDKVLGIMVAAIGRYYLATSTSFRPWLGAGLGWSWLEFTDEDTSFLGTTSEKEKTSYRGPVFAIAQGGADFKVDPRIWLGGFAGVYVGSFTGASSDGPEPETGGSFQLVLFALRVSGSIPL